MRRILIPIVILLLLLIAFVPQILSTPLGKPLFEQALSKRFDASVTIGTLHLSWLGPQSLEKIVISGEEMNGSIDELQSDVPLWSLGQFGNAFLMKNGAFSFPAFGNASITQVEAKIANQDIQATGVTQGGHLRIHGKFYSKNDFDLVTDMKGVPSALFDQFLEANGMLSSALGATVNLTSELIYNKSDGSLKLDFVSSNAQMSVQGKIEHDILLLTQPIHVSLSLSPELSQALRQRASLTVVEAKKPFQLHIAQEGTSIPLRPFSLERLEIGNGNLDLGQIVCDGVPSFVSFLTLLQSGQLASSRVPIWFTPVTFSIDRGLLTAGRMDALVANSIHLCTWGKINLVDSSLDMTLGIPADTLEKTLAIKGLARNIVLKIPVRGTIQKPEFVTGPTSAKIATLLAGKEIMKRTGAFGDLVNKVSPLNLGDQDAPPANRPFPWEK